MASKLKTNKISRDEVVRYRLLLVNPRLTSESGTLRTGNAVGFRSFSPQPEMLAQQLQYPIRSSQIAVFKI